jgi:phosphoribosyl 1,2-cyclic phosphodiesterase
MPLLHVAASGSSGNCSCIEHKDNLIFIDAGTAFKNIMEALNETELHSKRISLFLTHEHSDHVKGLQPFLTKLKPTVYTSEGTAHQLEKKGFDVSRFMILDPDYLYELDDFAVTPISITHDGHEPLAFRFNLGDSKIGYATDLGVAGNYILEHLGEVESVILEANYEESLLRHGSYPEYLKKRILSHKGHLSNQEAVNTVGHLSKDKLKRVIFAHVSQENNSYELLEKYTAFCRDNFCVEAMYLPRETVLKRIKL